MMRFYRLSLKNLLTFILPATGLIFLDASQFTGNQDKTVKIGLLVPDKKSVAAQHGAELAINEANRKGGLNGVPFELVTRYMEGSWGTGSKEAVSLIFDEKVWAILGSHDGRNAHIVEQAATKAHVVFVSAWSADPTLSQAFVPWFFNCVPTDRQQAESLVEEIFVIKKSDKVAVVYDESYDSKLSLKNFIEKIKISGRTEPLQFAFDETKTDPAALATGIDRAGAKCVVLLCEPSVSLKLIRQFRQKKMNLALYGSLSLLNENELSDLELSEYDNIIAVPSGVWTSPGSAGFLQQYQKTFNRIPGLVASYAWDGMNVLIEAIRKAGSPDREKIQGYIKSIRQEGVTGTIRFDEKGNRSGPFNMTVVKKGIPVIF